MLVIGGERHHDAAAYSPALKEWKTVAEPPLPDGSPQVVWTGSEVVAVVDTASGARHAATYDPSTDQWQKLPAPPAVRFPNLGGVMRPAFVWTPIGAILADAWALYDPSTSTWRTLPTPTPPLDLFGQPSAAVAQDTRVLVVEPGAETLVFNVASRTWTSEEVVPLARNVIGTFPGAVATGSTLYVLSDGQISASTGAAWSPVHSIDPHNDCTPYGLRVGGRPGFVNCIRLIIETDDGWTVEDIATHCCYREAISTGDTVLLWTSNDDTANDRTAPRAALWERQLGVGEDEGDGGQQLGEEVEVTTDPTASWKLTVRHRTQGDCIEIVQGRNRSGGCGTGVPDQQPIAVLRSGVDHSPFVFGPVRRDAPLVRILRDDGSNELRIPMDPGPSFPFLVYVFPPSATVGAIRIEIVDTSGAVLEAATIGA